MFIGPLLLLVVAPALRKIFLSGDRAVVADSEAEVVAEGSPEG
jgi:cobalt-zinc-cadmium resistance protein CzcA